MDEQVGDATIIDYSTTSAWEYNAYAFQACPGAPEDDPGCPRGAAPDGTPGQLLLDGVEYDLAFDKLLLDFYASGSFALSGANCAVFADTDLTLHPVLVDLRQESIGPISTKARFDIWNQNEVRFSGTERCITCWDQTLLSQYGAPNHFLITNLHTDKGKTRIDGVSSIRCSSSVNAAMLGVASRQVTFFCAAGTGFDQAGRTLVGQGEEAAAILYDIVTPPDQAQQEAADFTPKEISKDDRPVGR